MADPKFPTVPNAPGVPAVNRVGDNTVVTPSTSVFSLNSTDQRIINSATTGAKNWGVFDMETGFDTLQPTSYMDFNENVSYTVATFPIEGGQFRSYDKVQSPGTVKIRAMKVGTTNELQEFHATCIKLADSRKPSTVLNNGSVFRNMNCVNVDFSRPAKNGNSAIIATFTFKEILSSVTVEFTSVAKAPDASLSYRGARTPIPATSTGVPQ